ncbi:MAG: hypothetical protein ACRECJ_09510, partial [Limisphaerales bacterium]
MSIFISWVIVFSVAGFSTTAIFSVSVFSIFVTSDLVVFRFIFIVELCLRRAEGKFACYPAIRRLRVRSTSVS